jgi:hypothetical protein
MTSHLSCEEARELAPELALGTLSGDDRAKLIAHIGSCSGCRRFVEELAQIADTVLLLAPEHEPPAGFESEVLEQFKTIVRRKRAPWLVAASLIVVAALAALTTLWLTTEDRELGSHLRVALDEANGDYFGAKPLKDTSGTKVANVFSYGGQTSWVFVVWPQSPEEDRYRFTVHTRDGESLKLGSATLGEQQTWGAEIPIDLRDVAAMRVWNGSGDEFVVRFPAPN